MPRKYLKKILPSANHVRGLPGVSRFAHRLHDENLWHVNRRSVPLGIAIGLFFAYWPVPFQMILAAAAALILRANLPISVLLVWITNPLTMVPLYTPAYFLGSWILGERVRPMSELTLAALGRNIEALWIGCLIIGTVLAAVGWFLARAYWQWHVQHHWDLRRRRRRRRDDVDDDSL